MGEYVELSSSLVPETPAKTNEARPERVCVEIQLSPKVASSAMSSMFSSSKEKEQKEQNCEGIVGFIDLNSCLPEQVTENTCASPDQGLDFLHEGRLDFFSRGDTQEFSDLNKLANRFLKGSHKAQEGEAKDRPSLAYIQEVVEELRKGEQGECPICLEAFEDAVLTPCAHRLCRECLLASWRNPTSGLCPVCRKNISRQDLITAPIETRFQIDVEKNWVESSKVVVLLRELENLRMSGSKSIVFSQWTAFLDLLQIPLSRSNIPFVRLDGTLSQQQREKVLKQFSEDSNILVLLMSLKAGGVGINLTAASNAFVLDPWWNPAVEEQAVMCIHQIGQTKGVMIRRFIVKGTVEERMEAVQARKQRMISGALTDQEVRTARIEELKMLFT